MYEKTNYSGKMQQVGWPSNLREWYNQNKQDQGNMTYPYKSWKQYVHVNSLLVLHVVLKKM